MENSANPEPHQVNKLFQLRETQQPWSTGQQIKILQRQTEKIKFCWSERQAPGGACRGRAQRKPSHQPLPLARVWLSHVDSFLQTRKQFPGKAGCSRVRQLPVASYSPTLWLGALILQSSQEPEAALNVKIAVLPFPPPSSVTWSPDIAKRLSDAWLFPWRSETGLSPFRPFTASSPVSFCCYCCC